MSFWDDQADFGVTAETAGNLFSGTLTPEFSSGNDSGYAGTTAQPALASAPASEGFSLSGVLGTVQASAKGLLDVFGKAYQIRNAADDAKFAQVMKQGQLDVARAQLAGTIDVAKTRSMAEATIEKARAETAVARAQNDVATARNGGVPVIFSAGKDTWGLWLGVAGLVVAIYSARGKKAAA